MCTKPFGAGAAATPALALMECRTPTAQMYGLVVLSPPYYGAAVSECHAFLPWYACRSILVVGTCYPAFPFAPIICYTFSYASENESVRTCSDSWKRWKECSLSSCFFFQRLIAECQARNLFSLLLLCLNWLFQMELSECYKYVHVRRRREWI